VTSILWNRINTGLLLLVLLAIIGLFASRAYGGPLDPPGPPASTLPPVEPRTPIDHLPFTISQTGSYFLTGNLSVAGLTANGITVNANHVMIDLNGFQLLGGSSSGTGTGILVGLNPQYGLTVKNGTLGGWLQAIDGTNGRQAQFSDLVLSGNGNGLKMWESSDAQRIRASYNSVHGIELAGDHDVLSDSVIFQNTDGVVATGDGGQILNNQVDGGNLGIGVYGDGWRVEANNVFGNIVGTLPYGMYVQGPHNIVVRNSETQNGTNVVVVGLNNYVPQETAPTVTNPLSNVAY
jgi:hypothetical protein